jgi:hypothetical protein
VSKTNAFETDVAALIFHGTGIPGLADNAAASPLTNLYLSLHSADPGEAGDQTTSEVAYGGYARLAVSRSSAGFALFTAASTSSSFGCAVYVRPDLLWPTCISGSATVTYIGVGTDATGAGKLLYRCALLGSGSISISTGLTPSLLGSDNINATGSLLFVER